MAIRLTDSWPMSSYDAGEQPKGNGMANLKGWCGFTETDVNGNRLHLLEADDAKLEFAVDEVAKVVPGHYASLDRIADVMSRLGKHKSALFIQQKLPTATNIRSGDLGEILASSYVEEFTSYSIVIRRLRWKDHRNMAMRGDDIIGVESNNPASQIKFLKGEAKSSVSLTMRTLAEARQALDNNDGLPSPHSLSFLADRLHDEGQSALALLIDQANLVDGIRAAQVLHLIFVFSGNNPMPLLKKELSSYRGGFSQRSVGVRVNTHQQFIEAVYKKVAGDG
jgi:hypothetical protein